MARSFRHHRQSAHRQMRCMNSGVYEWTMPGQRGRTIDHWLGALTEPTPSRRLEALHVGRELRAER
jgi:hypothetical protein